MNSVDPENNFDTLDLLILVRLLAKFTAASVKKDVGAMAATHLAPGEWTDLFDLHWNRLLAAKLIGPRPGKKPGKTIILTDAGRRRALDFLGIAELPPKVTWTSIQSDFLLPLAMNLPAGSSEAVALKAAWPLKLSILSRAKQIKCRPGARAKNILAAIAWKLLGVESDADFTAENVIQQLGFRRPPKKMTADKVLTALAAAAVGTAKTGAADLRAAAIRHWLLAAATNETQAVKNTAAPGGTLEAFASQVIEAARRCPAEARFGDNKVFISHVWRQLNGGPAAALDLTAFKQKLLDANRDGLVQLSRADLVEAMNPTDVQESATIYDNATFHFVRIA
ncbi:MAG TPA: hypothetical protein VFI31_26625 [Pirellulales bacterium]|nr:hypothetical protein [Pirellulales bacterium]